MDNYFIAAASSDGKLIDQHFGKCNMFYIFRIDGNENFVQVENRSITSACSDCGAHNDARTLSAVQTLADCKYVLCAKIGPGSWRALEEAGVHPLEITHFIDYAIPKVMAYDHKFMRRRKS